MKTVDARIKTIKKGQMIYYQPQLKLGWWIFKIWIPVYANTNSGYLSLNITSDSMYNVYEEAMKHFDEYHKLTNNNYRMVHPEPVEVW